MVSKVLGGGGEGGPPGVLQDRGWRTPPIPGGGGIPPLPPHWPQTFFLHGTRIFFRRVAPISQKTIHFPINFVRNNDDVQKYFFISFLSLRGELCHGVDEFLTTVAFDQRHDFIF